jgi:predicted CoA-binding protein
MTTKRDVDEFASQGKLALVGMSGKKKKFGNQIYQELTASGYELFPVHPTAKSIDGRTCWPTLAAVPEPVEGVIIAVPPQSAFQVVKEAVQAGLERIWLQPGADSPEAIRYGEEHGVNVIHGHCVLMFMGSSHWIHRLHGWFWGVLGKLPK